MKMEKVLPDIEAPVSILVVEAHPDDATIFAGGTLARLAEEGHTITNLCSTYGAKGTLDSSMTEEKMIEIEKRESQHAAKVLGIKEVIYLGIPDGELTPGLELRRSYTEVLRRVQPDIVFGFDPYLPYDPHPDHRAAGRSIYEACYTSHFHLYFKEQQTDGLTPHYVNYYYGWNSPNPNIYIDISSTLEIKIQALMQYESQMQMLLQESRTRFQLAGIPVPTLDEMTWQEFVRYWITTTAQDLGKEVKYHFAEAFNILTFGALGAVPEK